MVFFEMLLERNNVYNHMIYLTDNYAQNSHFFFFFFPTLNRFSRPILHGLCTLGFAVRAVIKCICGGDQNMIKNITGRFLLHVYPGETLITEMWLDGLR